MVDLSKYRGKIYKIIGHSHDVYNEYHGGLQESAYEAALCYLLDKDNLHPYRQRELPIYYKGVKLNQRYRLDIVVNDEIILELKAAEGITKEHHSQLFNYMRLTHIPIGLLINFSLHNGVQCHKFYYDDVKNECIPF